MINIGIDVGAISVKVAIIGDEKDKEILSKIASESEDFFHIDDTENSSLLNGKFILVSKYKRIKGVPVHTTYEILDELYKLIPEDRIGAVCVTGGGGKLISQILGIPYVNDFKSVAQGVGTLHPDVQTVFEMGGDNSRYIHIELDKDTGSVGILDYEKNGECAAGTGSFMDQQANRLKFDIEIVGDIVMEAGASANIAGRCSVFAKSDMIHAQQKGIQRPEILKGLCDAVVRNFKGTIVKSRELHPKVAFIGGVAANKGIVQAMQTLFELSDDDFFVPEYYAWMSAIGAGLLADKEKNAKSLSKNEVKNLGEYADTATRDFPTMQPLNTEKVVPLGNRIKPYSFEGRALPIDAYLGIDVGSVSTNLVVIDENGDLVMEIYVPTESRPIDVVNENLKVIEEKIGDKVKIRGVGTTGSGRELIGVLTGADTINDEITAHKTGATHVADKLTGNRPDTIFEIGGQDSKYISIQNDVVVDFTMNEACAAGTGSFLEEQAEKLGIQIKGEFAQLALSSQKPIRLGERCTVFMEKDLNPYLQRGAKVEDLVAGLAYSIATNYLNRVVRGRYVGNCIFFQGGTAYNDSVAAAFATILDKEVIVPPHNGVIGAIGVALLAKEKMEAGLVEEQDYQERISTFRGFDLTKIDYKIRSFVCPGCSNHCDIQEVRIEDERTYWGDKCSDRYRKQAKSDKKPVIPDLMDFRQELVFGKYDAKDRILDAKGPTIGIPRAMYTYDRLPFWGEFLSQLDFNVVLSDTSNKKVINYGIDSVVAEPCFPLKVAHGHVRDLLEKGVDYIFIPNVINSETEFMDVNSHMCPWGQTMTFVIKHAPIMEGHEIKLLQPTIHFRDGKEAVVKELEEFGKAFGFNKSRIQKAVDSAYKAQSDFQQKLVEVGREALKTLDEKDELGIVIVGRSYNIYDSGVNLAVPRKLREYYGVNVIPFDFLPIEGVQIADVNSNMYWNYGKKIVQAAKVVGNHPNLHIIYITNFKCGPDSYIKQYIRKASNGKPFLSLQFDGHSNDAGFMTRCEAYLDSKGFLRWWKRQQVAV
jgi:predicted CoA-substrate-specific enzyme activase